MQQQQPSSVRLLTALGDAFRQPDLRMKILFTFAMLVIFRFAANVPIPNVDRNALDRLFQDNQLFNFLNLFSGNGLRRLSIVSMGVYPYITASIIMQLLVPVIPRLADLSKEGEYGRQKINQYTHWLTVPLAFAQAYGQLVLLQRQGVISGIGFGSGEMLNTSAAVLTMTAGSMFLVWLGELITEKGIGNGISMIIFGGIVAGFPGIAKQVFDSQGIGSGLLLIALVAAVVLYAIVVFTEAHRRIPVQYGRSLFRGGRMYRQAGASYIPLRVNTAGMIPLIFAFSIMIFPSIVASYFVGTSHQGLSDFARSVQNLFSPTSTLYWLLTFLLVIIFTFFYTLVIFQQQNLAENLQKNGGFIPGIRPGKPTEEYLSKVVLRITVAGALFLGIVAVLPYFARQLSGFTNIQTSSSALLIVVGVALDTMRQLESQLMMRRYESFIR
ncbi:MAG: preprotein translocase subunit SecY [Chloroflexi bacterium]|nr:preprotein translocase subunit SecY [Chloroflexota bacterium]